MTTEENKAVLRRVHETINSGDLDAYAQLVAPDAVDHGLPPGFPAGPEGARTLLSMIRDTFPDFRMTTDDLIAEGDKVVARLTCTGTHRGDFMGVPATGKQVSWGVIEILRVANGKVAERWSQTDTLGLMQQLGAIPAPE